MSPGRRSLVYAVLLCAVGAGLAFFATTRTWAVEVTVRAAPLPGLRASRTGADVLPWLPALALVGLAGAGAVLATRRAARRLVGGLLLLVGLGMAGGAGFGLSGLDRGEAGPAWPMLCLIGGSLAAAGGLMTLAQGQRWPTMGARYERPAVSRPADAGGAARGGDDSGATRGGDDGGGGGDTDGGIGRRRTAEVWDALDRGEDPTVARPRDRDRRD